jgi:hypothetical protein
MEIDTCPATEQRLPNSNWLLRGTTSDPVGPSVDVAVVGEQTVTGVVSKIRLEGSGMSLAVLEADYMVPWSYDFRNAPDQ